MSTLRVVRASAAAFAPAAVMQMRPASKAAHICMTAAAVKKVSAGKKVATKKVSAKKPEAKNVVAAKKVQAKKAVEKAAVKKVVAKKVAKKAAKKTAAVKNAAAKRVKAAKKEAAALKVKQANLEPPPPQPGRSDGTAAVPEVKVEDAVMRPSNEVSEETLTPENAKEEKKNAEKKELNAEKKILNAKEEMLNDEKKMLNDKKKKLNAKEETLNAHILILTRRQRENRFQSEDLGDTLVYFSTCTPSAADVAEMLKGLKGSQLSVQGQLEKVQGQLEKVQGQLEAVPEATDRSVNHGRSTP